MFVLEGERRGGVFTSSNFFQVSSQADETILCFLSDSGIFSVFRPSQVHKHFQTFHIMKHHFYVARVFIDTIKQLIIKDRGGIKEVCIVTKRETNVETCTFQV